MDASSAVWNHNDNETHKSLQTLKPKPYISVLGRATRTRASRLGAATMTRRTRRGMTTAPPASSA